MPSQAEIEEYRSDLSLITAAAVAEATRVAASVASEPVDRMEAILVAAIPELLRPYIAAAAQLAALFYQQSGPGGAASRPRTAGGRGGSALAAGAGLVRPAPSTMSAPRPTPTAARQPAESTQLRRDSDLPRRPGATIAGPTDRRSLAAAESFRPRPAEGPPAARIESSVRWAVSVARAEPGAADSTVASRLAGAVQRHVASAARDTITTNADLEGARWYRQAQPDACAFCRMLATRGPDYLSEESAKRVVGVRGKSRRGRPGELLGRQRRTRAIGELYHDDCNCEPVAVRPGDTYTPPEYADEWMDQYLKAAAASNGSTKSILSEMRKLSTGSKA